MTDTVALSANQTDDAPPPGPLDRHFARLCALLANVPEGVALALGTLVCWVQVLKRVGGSIYLDDSLITMHVVNNALAGHGLVFNVGEHYMVYSNPGYAVLLYFVAWLGHITVPMAVQMLFLGASLALPIAAGLMFRGIGPMIAGPIACLFLFQSEEMWYSLKGMETSLFVLCVTTAFALLRLGWPTVGALFASYAMLCRPDGVVIPPLYLLVVAMGLREDSVGQPFPWRRLIKPAVALVAVGAVWAVASIAMYGTFVPLTVKAKSVLKDQGTPSLLSEALVRGRGQWKLFLVPLAASVALILADRRRWLLLPVLFGFANLAMLFAGRAPYFHWYFAPAYFSGLLAMAWAATRVAKLVVREGAWRAVGLATALALGALVWPPPGPKEARENLIPRIEQGKAEAATYIAKHRQEGDWVAGAEVGFLGYFSESPVLDTNGLLQDYTHDKLRIADRSGILIERRPRWLFGSFSAGDAVTLEENYTLRHAHSRYNVYELFPWAPETVLANSPELAEALGRGEPVRIAKWPMIAGDFEAFLALVKAKHSAADVALISFGRAEEFLKTPPGVRFFQAVSDQQKLVPAAELQSFVDSYRQGAFNQGAATWNLVDAQPSLRMMEAQRRPGQVPLLRPTGWDCQLMYGGPVLPTMRHALVRYRITGKASAPVQRKFTMFYDTKEKPGFDATRSFTAMATDDGAEHTALVLLGDRIASLSKNEKVNALRLDPIESYLGSTVEVLEWTLLPAAK